MESLDTKKQTVTPQCDPLFIATFVNGWGDNRGIVTTMISLLLLPNSYKGISPMTTQTKVQKPRLPPHTVSTLPTFKKTKGVCSNPSHLVTIKLPSKVYYHPLQSSYCLCNLEISTTMYYHQAWDPWRIRGGSVMNFLTLPHTFYFYLMTRFSFLFLLSTFTFGSDES